MEQVAKRSATFKKILNVTSGNFLEQYDFFLFWILCNLYCSQVFSFRK